MISKTIQSCRTEQTINGPKASTEGKAMNVIPLEAVLQAKANFCRSIFYKAAQPN